MLYGRHTCLPFYQITEIIGGKAKFVCAILHRWDALCYRLVRIVIIVKQYLEACKQVAVYVFASDELAVVEADATVKKQLYGVDYE